MKKHFYVFVSAAMLIASAASFVTSCSSRGGGTENSKEEAAIRLFLGKLEVPLFDSISVHISAPDMESIYISERAASDYLKINAVPQGENRKFEVTIYADSGKPVQKGEATADIIADKSISIQIKLNALAGFLRLEIPLGVSNSTGVRSGKLYLGELEFDMVFETGKGVFSTGSLPLNESIQLKIELYDAEGDVLFYGSKELTLTSIFQDETIIQLNSTRGSAILDLQEDEEDDLLHKILAVLPSSVSKSRAPENYGELFFTEISPNPTEGEYFQYMELYNITLDTLQLKGCKIARNQDYNDSKNRLTLSNLILPPMEYIVLGRSSVINADSNYTSFQLLVGGQSLGFFCGDLAIDTLTYSNKGDNAFPLEKGHAMQLPLENYENRSLGKSWCFGSSPKSDAACQ
jgi:hypothetical protein